MKKWISLLFLLISVTAFSQSSNHFFLEATTGARYGWWQFNRGSEQASAFSDQGLDYSHFSPFVPFGISVGYKTNSLQLKAGVHYTIFFDAELRRHQRAGFAGDRIYRIASSRIRFLHYFVEIAKPVLKNQQLEVGPFARIGGFQAYTEFPEDPNFGQRWFWEAGVQIAFPIKKWTGIIRPSYQLNYLSLEETDFTNQYHRIFSLGLETTLRLPL